VYNISGGATGADSQKEKKFKRKEKILTPEPILCLPNMSTESSPFRYSNSEIRRLKLVEIEYLVIARYFVAAC
jgi:hypothetical protein